MSIYQVLIIIPVENPDYPTKGYSLYILVAIKKGEGNETKKYVILQISHYHMIFAIVNSNTVK